MRRYIEAGLLLAKDMGRQFRSHQLLENDLLPRPMHLEMLRQGGGKFHDAMIQKRRPHFNGMRHAHSVHFGENIVRQKILLVEPELSIQTAARQKGLPQKACQIS